MLTKINQSLQSHINKHKENRMKLYQVTALILMIIPAFANAGEWDYHI